MSSLPRIRSVEPDRPGDGAIQARQAGRDAERAMTDARRRFQTTDATRTELFARLVAEAIDATPHPATVLDIGCGHGFDGDPVAQWNLARRAGRMIGIEPDEQIQPLGCFHDVHRRPTEDAPIPPGSIDVAYSSFVLEHVGEPVRFWNAVHRALRPGGVFLGFTVDLRHPFALASAAMGALRLKDLYLNRLHGRRGETRYETYPTRYLANTPRRIRRDAAAFTDARFATWHRVGQLDFYVPSPLRPLAHLGDRLSMAAGLGSILVVRLVK